MTETRVLHVSRTESTNADAMRLAKDGTRGPIWIVAREQVSGRGRHGRAWLSPPGNLYASLLLDEPCLVEIAPQLGFVTGVALVEAIAALGIHDIALKWPNDLLCGGAKFAGILLESSRLESGQLACVIGVGVNCTSHPADLLYLATNLSECAGRAVAPEELFSALDEALIRWLRRWDRGRDFSAVRDAWLTAAAGRGGAVNVALHDRAVDGTFETIDETGRFVVRTAAGTLAIDAGDVRFAPGVLARVPIHVA